MRLLPTRRVARSIRMRGPLGAWYVRYVGTWASLVAVPFILGGIILLKPGGIVIGSGILMVHYCIQLVWVFRRMRWEALGGCETCLVCGYPMLGLQASAACPECGEPYSVAESERVMRRLGVVRRRAARADSPRKHDTG